MTSEIFVLTPRQTQQIVNLTAWSEREINRALARWLPYGLVKSEICALAPFPTALAKDRFVEALEKIMNLPELRARAAELNVQAPAMAA